MKRSRSLSKTIFVGISVAYLAGAGCGKPPTPGTVAPKTTVADAKALHAKHCGACHGENGNGEGPGSRSLWPKARNFRRESFRLVSTKYQIPSVEDVETVIEDNSRLRYTDKRNNVYYTQQITVISIDTDEGVLEPLGVGEILIEIRY